MKIGHVLLIGMLAILLSVGVTIASTSGTLEPGSGPESTSSYTMKQIYQRLTTGNADAAQNMFTEPLLGPTSGTMFTLDEIMGAAPAMDNVNGATAADVASGKTYWGLRNGEWGVKTGTLESSCDVASSGACIVEVLGSIPGIPKTGDVYSDPDVTGEDGETQLGIEPALEPSRGKTGAYNTPVWVGVRFTENGDGTVTDNVTGLIWLQNANCADADRTWASALDDVVSLNGGGTMKGINCDDTSNGGSHQTDWRLPNVNELHSLIDLRQSSPALPTGHPFTGVQPFYYWSSTSYADNPIYAWYVYLSYGDVRRDDTFNGCYVWPVRGGQ